MKNEKHEQLNLFEKQKPNNKAKIIKAIGGGVVILAAAAFGVNYVEAKSNALPTPNQIETNITKLPKNSDGIQYFTSIVFPKGFPVVKYEWRRMIPNSSGQYFSIDLFSNYVNNQRKLNLNKVNEIEVNLNDLESSANDYEPSESLSLFVNNGQLIESFYGQNVFNNDYLGYVIVKTNKIGISGFGVSSHVSNKELSEIGFRSRQVQERITDDILNDINQIVFDFKNHNPLPYQNPLISFSALLPTKN